MQKTKFKIITSQNFFNKISFGFCLLKNQFTPPCITLSIACINLLSLIKSYVSLGFVLRHVKVSFIFTQQGSF